MAQQPVAMNHRTFYLGLNSSVIYFKPHTSHIILNQFVSLTLRFLIFKSVPHTDMSIGWILSAKGMASGLLLLPLVLGCQALTMA